MKIKTQNPKDLLDATNQMAAEYDTNSCVVYAFSSVFGYSYIDSQIECRDRFDRQKRQGTRMSKLQAHFRNVTEINGRKIGIIENKPTKCVWSKRMSKYVVRPMRVSDFVKENPNGTFFLVVRNHALAIVDGVIVDNMSDARNSKMGIVQYSIKINK